MLCLGEGCSAQDICSQATFVITDIPACVYGVLMKTYCSKATVEGIVIESCCKIENIWVVPRSVLFIAFRWPCLLWRWAHIFILPFQSDQYAVHFWKSKLISQTNCKDCCSRLHWLCQRTYRISMCCHSVCHWSYQWMPGTLLVF